MKVPDLRRLRGAERTEAQKAQDRVSKGRVPVHGHSLLRGKPTRTYNTWASMHNRCRNPAQKCYPRYGGRGIAVCPRWTSFAAFLADMGERPEGKTLDRINPDGHYEPSNCRWATPGEQRKNRRVRT